MRLAALCIVCGFVIAAGSYVRADEQAAHPGGKPAIAADAVDFATGDLLLAWDDDAPQTVAGPGDPHPPRDPPPPPRRRERDRPGQQQGGDERIPGPLDPPLRGPEPLGPTSGKVIGKGAPGGKMGGGRFGEGGMGGGRFGPGEMGIGRFGEEGGRFGADGMSGMMGSRRPADPEMMKLDQADAELENATHELTEQYRSGDGPVEAGLTQSEELKKLREKLAAVVQKHFQVRQERRELELKRLEKQLDHLRGVIEKRTAGKDAIIKSRMTQLLGEQDDLSF